MTRAEILDKAKECVCGQREQDYGTPEDNFTRIADLWNGYLGERGERIINSTDVAMMMALLKIARIRTGTGTKDSFIDLAGYAACGGEIATTSNHAVSERTIEFLRQLSKEDNKEENDRRNEECKKKWVELLEIQIESLDNYRNYAERILFFAENGASELAKGVLESMSELIDVNKRTLQAEIDSIKSERVCEDKVYQLLSSKEKEDVE